MALALERSIALASPTRIGEWVGTLASDALEERSRVVQSIELAPDDEPSEAAPAVTSPTSHPSRRRWVPIAIGVGAAATIGLVVGMRSARVSVARTDSLALPEVPAQPAPTPSGSDDVAQSAVVVTPTPSARVDTSVSRGAHKSASSPPPAKPCAVKWHVDEAGVKHFYRDCGR
jgi:hypothetical protein